MKRQKDKEAKPAIGRNDRRFRDYFTADASLQLGCGQFWNWCEFVEITFLRMQPIHDPNILLSPDILADFESARQKCSESVKNIWGQR